MDSLDSSPDRLVAETFVARAEHHVELGSTNDRAAELGRDGGSLPALVVTDRQTSGRGRGSNRWWSAEGSLTFSIVLERDAVALPPDRLPLLALATGLAVREAAADVLSQSGSDSEPLLKWPNDILVGDRKLAGILVEETGGRVVIGVGLNVNNTFAGGPEDVRVRAMSLIDLSNQEIDRSSLLVEIVRRLSDEIELLGQREPRIAERFARVCALSSRPIRVRVHERNVDGICHGIDETGALVVRTSTGTERILSGVVDSFG